MTARAGSGAGFTLVELLVALSLIAILSTLVLGGLRFGARSWEAVVAETETRDRVAAVHRFLRARLGGIARAGQAGVWLHAPEVEGGADEIAFSGPWHTAYGYGGLYRFRLWQAEGALRLAWRPLAPGAGSATEGERVILDGVASLGIAYYERPTPERAGGWRRTWRERPAAPPLVRVDVGFDGTGRGSDRVWPPLVVRLRD